MNDNAAQVCDRMKIDLYSFSYIAIHKEHSKCTFYNYVRNEVWLYVEIERVMKCYTCMHEGGRDYVYERASK